MFDYDWKRYDFKFNFVGLDGEIKVNTPRALKSNRNDYHFQKKLGRVPSVIRHKLITPAYDFMSMDEKGKDFYLTAKDELNDFIKQHLVPEGLSAY